MNAQPPSIPDVTLAIAAVVIGCVAGAYAAYSGWRSGNWIAYVCAAGLVAFVTGIVGQRVFPSQAAIDSVGPALAPSSRPGPWDAGVSLPLIGIKITPVTLGGLLVAAFAVSLLLLFERVVDPSRLRATHHRGLEEEDAV
ncbi:MAG: hypothetical protein ABR498_06120 [Candidatus Dormibacteria bacterium]